MFIFPDNRESWSNTMGPVSMYLYVITALRTGLGPCRRAGNTDLLSPLLGVSQSSGTGVQTADRDSSYGH